MASFNTYLEMRRKMSFARLPSAAGCTHRLLLHPASAYNGVAPMGVDAPLLERERRGEDGKNKGGKNWKGKGGKEGKGKGKDGKSKGSVGEAKGSNTRRLERKMLRMWSPWPYQSLFVQRGRREKGVEGASGDWHHDPATARGVELFPGPSVGRKPPSPSITVEAEETELTILRRNFG